MWTKKNILSTGITERSAASPEATSLQRGVSPALMGRRLCCLVPPGSGIELPGDSPSHTTTHRCVLWEGSSVTISLLRRHRCSRYYFLTIFYLIYLLVCFTCLLSTRLCRLGDETVLIFVPPTLHAFLKTIGING